MESHQVDFNFYTTLRIQYPVFPLCQLSFSRLRANLGSKHWRTLVCCPLTFSSFGLAVERSLAWCERAVTETRCQRTCIGISVFKYKWIYFLVSIILYVVYMAAHVLMSDDCRETGIVSSGKEDQWETFRSVNLKYPDFRQCLKDDLTGGIRAIFNDYMFKHELISSADDLRSMKD